MKFTGQAAVTLNGDISNSSVVAGPIDARSLSNLAIQAVLAGVSVNGTLQLQGSVGNPATPSQGPGGSGQTWPNPWANVGSAVSFTGAGQTTWDIAETGLSVFQVVWTKTGTSSSGNNGLTVNVNGK